MDAAVAKKADVVTEPQSAAQSPDMAIPFGVKFTGYARYGAHFRGCRSEIRGCRWLLQRRVRDRSSG
ncbi:hypothetical protein IE994_06355 [Enterobacter hormaechei]|uniref:Uncharacterized protein n=1 Tax=Enterobacter hormaechei TaxID=158836 RepID=A0A927DI89_9ENTR|nr:hypothetical protein [Enterobacter hormaechei]MBD3707109.1 hypothetical protein [Enterobacter hormaechei]MBD3716898.1 hypothetical protein [Enterobacter hormaechei]